MNTFTNVSIEPKGNTYFDGKVTSHTITLADGSRKTLGFISPGSYHFDTAAPEIMAISDGSCTVILDGTQDSKKVTSGCSFEVPGDSGFTINVTDGICQYICSYL